MQYTCIIAKIYIKSLYIKNMPAYDLEYYLFDISFVKFKKKYFVLLKRSHFLLLFFFFLFLEIIWASLCNFLGKGLFQKWFVIAFFLGLRENDRPNITQHHGFVSKAGLQLSLLVSNLMP